MKVTKQNTTIFVASKLFLHLRQASWAFSMLLIAALATYSCKSVQKSYSGSTTVSSAEDSTEEQVDQKDLVCKMDDRVGPYRAEQTKHFDLIHTKLDVRFDWEKQYLYGTEVVSMKPHFYEEDTVVLDAKGMDIKKVALIQAADADIPGQELDYTYENEEFLVIALDKTYNKNDVLTLYIEYTAKPNELESGGSKAITSDKGLYFINPLGEDTSKPRQIWTQGETEASSCWFPTIDQPNQKTTQEIRMTVDTQFVTLSNGLLVGSQDNGDGTRTDHWKQTLPHAPYLFMMTVGDFAIVKDQWRDMPVHYYVEPAYEEHAMAVFGHTPEMIEFFSKRLGVDYPWEKYHSIVVRDFVSGAMENTTASLFMEGLQITKRERIDKTWDGIIAHELFHHWFGDYVTCESWSNLPLNESFANYSEYLWFEHFKGRSYADYLAQDETKQYLAEAENKKVDLIRFYYEDKEDMFDRHSYNKGGRILHMLRKYLGDEAFFASLAYYLKENKFSDVEVHNLRLALEEVTGEDLNWFFNQWFLSAGHPKLKVDYSYDKGEIQLEVEQVQDSLVSPKAYKLPLKVDVWTSDDSKQRFSITIDKRKQRFSLESKKEPLWVHFDAEEQLLAEVQYHMEEENYFQQFMLAGLYLPKDRSLKYYATQGDSLHAEKVLLKALDDEFWGIREQAIGIVESWEAQRQAPFLKKIHRLALEDPNSKVRASAMGFFGTADYAPMYPAMFEKGLKDSSYMVNARSLVGYLHTAGRKKVLAKLQEYEDINNLEIIRIVGEFYGALASLDKLDWYKRIIDRHGGQKEYYTVNNLGYLLQQLESEEDQMVVVRYLAEICRSEESWKYSKFAAYRAMAALKEKEEVKNLIDEIYEKEEKQFLKKLYDNVR